MLRIDPKWGETAQSLFLKSLKEQDQHLRIRLTALHLIAGGDSAVTAAFKLGVHRVSVSE